MRRPSSSATSIGGQFSRRPSLSVHCRASGRVQEGFTFEHARHTLSTKNAKNKLRQFCRRRDLFSTHFRSAESPRSGPLRSHLECRTFPTQ